MPILVVEVVRYLHKLELVKFDEYGITGDCFVSRLPLKPDECVGIFPSGGYQADGKLPLDYPTFQIIVRGTQDPRTALIRAQNIYDALHGYAGFFVGELQDEDGTRIVNCRGIQSGPVYIGQDENNRHRYSLNFELIIENMKRSW